MCCVWLLAQSLRVENWSRLQSKDILCDKNSIWLCAHAWHRIKKISKLICTWMAPASEKAKDQLSHVLEICACTSFGYFTATSKQCICMFAVFLVLLCGLGQHGLFRFSHFQMVFNQCSGWCNYWQGRKRHQAIARGDRGTDKGTFFMPGFVLSVWDLDIS